jgi:hypothetical protein
MMDLVIFVCLLIVVVWLVGAVALPAILALDGLQVFAIFLVGAVIMLFKT